MESKETDWFDDLNRKSLEDLLNYIRIRVYGSALDVDLTCITIYEKVLPLLEEIIIDHKEVPEDKVKELFKDTYQSLERVIENNKKIIEPQKREPENTHRRLMTQEELMEKLQKGYTVRSKASHNYGGGNIKIIKDSIDLNNENPEPGTSFLVLSYFCKSMEHLNKEYVLVSPEGIENDFTIV